MRQLVYSDEAIDAVIKHLQLDYEYAWGVREAINGLPQAQPEPRVIDYSYCANAMLKMWIDEVLTDGEYYRIMDKLNAHWTKEG